MMRDTRERAAYSYVTRQSQDLFFVLSGDGSILEANESARALTGCRENDTFFSDLVVDFAGIFNLADLVEAPDGPQLLNIKTAAGPPQSFDFYFTRVQHIVLAFGRLDAREMEQLQKQMLSLNQELNNLTRELNRKNRELARANEKILALSRTDHLTGLANRAYFSERIEQMISLAVRKSRPLSLIMTDIDQFKTINDTFGHDAGDRVLQGFAGLMKNSTRTEDLVARFGGEEFIILLPLTDICEAHAYAERIRLALPQKDLLQNGHPIFASFGVSQLLPDETSAGLIKRADMALYRAKTSGRNRTVTATGNGAHPSGT